MRIIRTTQVIFMLLLLTTLSCDEFVDVDVPDTQLSQVQVFEDTRTAESVLTHVYTRLHNSVLVTGDSGGITVLLGNYTDELACHNTTLPEIAFNENNLLGTDATIQSIWRNAYNLVYVLNTVLEGIEGSTAISQPDRERLMGEALFTRAYLHFYLNQLFGAVPYVTTTDYRVNTTIGKSSDATIHLLLQKDLDLSADLLPESYVGDYRVRPNKNTAMALLARLYLNQGKWDLAQQKATSVIENTSLYQWVENLDSVFLRNSTGTIWQLMSSPEGKNTLEAKSFIFTTVPPPNRSLRNDFVAQFEQGDLRKANWVRAVTDGAAMFHHAYKYKLQADTGSSEEYPIQFRLEEMYLIRAEANTELGLLEPAKTDLNRIRHRAGLGDTQAGSKDELIAAIVKERQFEFFCELGHRFFDLKRRNLLDSILDATKPGWETTDALFPLPENELLLNPNLLPQNLGY